MRFGFETVLWGRRIDDLEYALEVIARCGYEGVEFAQHPSQIFVREKDDARPVRDVEEMLALLRKHGLELIGLVEGSLRERMDFLQGHTEAYLYLDRWPPNEPDFKQEVAACLDAGFTLALHPHWLMPIRRLRDALAIIRAKNSDRVRLLMDTAHAIIAEDDPVEIVEKHFDKLVAIHVKDWRPDYGRWSHRYAHGFCMPGRGIVHPEKVMDALHAGGFDGWIIFEQDHFDYRREATALAGARWMAEHGARWGVSVHCDESWIEARLKEDRPNPFVHFEEFEEREFRLGRELSRRISPRPDAAQFYASVTATLRRVLDAQAAKVWSYNPLTGDFCLLGMDAKDCDWLRCEPILRESKPECGDRRSVAESLMQHPHICERDLSRPDVVAQFADQEWLKRIAPHARWMTVLPVFNTSNSHQLRFLITLYTRDSLLKPLPEKNELPENVNAQARLIRQRAGQLERLVWVVAHWADYLTDEVCLAASGATNHLCGNFKGGVTQFIDALMEHLQDLFQCNSVTIFLRDLSGTRVEPAGKSNTRLQWQGRAQSYRAGDGHTGKSFQDREMVFDSRAKTGNAREIRPSDDPRDEILFAPLVRRRGDCHGVVRLHNKHRTPGSPASTMFTDDDAARLDAVIQTALPYLELLMMQESQKSALARMIHELQAPLVAIRGSVDAMQTDLRRRKQHVTDVFRADFLEQTMQWTELMGRLVRNSQVFAGGIESLPLIKRKTLLRSDVIVPVIHQVRGLLSKSVRLEFDYRGFDEIPALWIDRDQLQQVLFNLLSNSFKYGRATDSVRIEIVAGEVGGTYCISFSDWGRGIPEEIKEEIFLPGFRGATAQIDATSGQGWGLFVVRSIIAAHGGTIRVVSCRLPTTFEITLPRTLRNAPLARS